MCRRLFVWLLVGAFGFCTISAPAVAGRRFSQGRNVGLYGYSRSAAVPRGLPQGHRFSAVPPRSMPPPIAPAAPRSNWFAPAAGGLLAGLGLGALFSHFNTPSPAGVASPAVVADPMTSQNAVAPYPAAPMAYDTPGHSLLTWLVLIALMVGAFLIARRFLSRNRFSENKSDGYVPAEPAVVYDGRDTFQDQDEQLTGSVYEFLELSKQVFVDVQRFFDHRDLAALRTVVSEQLLQDMRSELATPPEKEARIIRLDAHFRGTTQENAETVACVAFEGLIKETDDAPATDIRETWYFTKNRNAARLWYVTGIEQHS